MAESLYSLLSIAARRHPDRTAVDFADHCITYSDLLIRSERVAGFLHAHGVGPGACVAFCFRKSIEAIVALFGVIRTGATYVPLDTAWPAQRIADICDDANIHHWIGTKPPPDTVGRMELILNTEPAAPAGMAKGATLDAAQNAPPIMGAPHEPLDDICSLLYTSGTTGRPKGVRITGRSLLHFSRWAVDTFDMSADDRVANHAPFHFDLSTLDVFGAIRAGATLCPVPDRIRAFPGELARFIDNQRISIWYSVPSVLSQIARVWDRSSAPATLRTALFAGEVMPKPAVIDLARLLPGACLANLYGPTETNVCTWHRVGPDDLADPGPLPIGLPIDEMRIWFDSGTGHPDTLARFGELWVAGPTVAAGYHGHAARSDRFLSAPDGIGIAYRSGDRVLRRGDGLLMFDGRIDRQFKARGHRVEPGEIESVIASHPAVREVAVVPIADPQLGHRLMACLSPDPKQPITSGEIAEYCRARLPIYMVPDAWIVRETLPRTERGKIDLQAIASIAQG